MKQYLLIGLVTACAPKHSTPEPLVYEEETTLIEGDFQQDKDKFLDKIVLRGNTAYYYRSIEDGSYEAHRIPGKVTYRDINEDGIDDVIIAASNGRVIHEQKYISPNVFENTYRLMPEKIAHQ